jgi:hypothetical protein
MVVFLLEEPSAEALIRGLLPKLFPEEGTIDARFVVFEGKQDLEKKMERRIRGWLHPASFVVLRDQDAGDCRVVKQGLAARAAAGGRADALVRVACKELEAWVLGDWPAIAAEFNIPSVAELGRKAGGCDHRRRTRSCGPEVPFSQYVPLAWNIINKWNISHRALSNQLVP